MKYKIILYYALIIISILLGAYLVIYFGLSLKKFADRPITANQLPKEVKENLDKTLDCSNENEAIKKSLRLTASYLQFTKKNNISAGEANCIGYSQLCSAIVNEYFRANGFLGHAKPVVGYVMFMDLNLCSLLREFAPKEWKNFVKDHDFVEVSYGGSIIFIDPSIYDVLGTSCHTSYNK